MSMNHKLFIFNLIDVFLACSLVLYSPLYGFILAIGFCIIYYFALRRVFELGRVKYKPKIAALIALCWLGYSSHDILKQLKLYLNFNFKAREKK